MSAIKEKGDKNVAMDEGDSTSENQPPLYHMLKLSGHCLFLIE